jgi:hypothetical protein
LVTSLSQNGRFTFESYGFRVSLESDNGALLTKAADIAREALVGRISLIENQSSFAGYRFGLALKDGVYYLYQNGELTNHSPSEYLMFKYFNSILRITVAEHAVNTVFVHAGVIGWREKAVIFPGRSFRGKTTLVAELLKHGAVYYSDEYAVIGSDGLVSPFPRDLSLRSYFIENDEVAVPPSELGAQIGTAPLKVGSVIITEFDKKLTWDPRMLTIGEGILETIPHTIPINADTEMSLKILNLAFSSAIIAKSFRGDVKRDAVPILAFLDKHLN